MDVKASPIPKKVWNPHSGTAVKGRIDHQKSLDGIGMGSDGKFGDAPVPTGHWVFFVPRMERPGCAPRPAFNITAKMFYEIVFELRGAGAVFRDSVEQPVGLQHPELRHIVAHVCTSEGRFINHVQRGSDESAPSAASRSSFSGCIRHSC